MDKLIGYGGELFTHSCLQGLYYFIIYIYTRLKLKYEFNFLLYKSNIYIYNKPYNGTLTLQICHLSSFVGSCRFPQTMHQGTLN
jgi:hypothetical protein